jgi:uncharacterized membrane protein HdeD (DUF308 family)
MIKGYNQMSFALGVPGIILQLVGLYAAMMMGSSWGAAFIAVGICLFIAGLAYYAKAKARSPWWCLLGLLSLLGMIILSLIPDRSFEAEMSS